MKVVPVKNLANGNLDLDDLRAKAEKHKDRLAAFMVRATLSVVRKCTDGILDRSRTRRRMVSSNLVFRR